MSAVSSHLKRIKWRQAYRDSVSESISFSAKLDAIEEEIATEVDGGKDVQSTSTGQRTVSFFKGVEPQDRAAFILELQDTYAEARLSLIEDGTATPTDAQIYAEGETYLMPCDDTEADYSGLRCPHDPVNV